MATQVTNYQCPACTAPLHFIAESGRLECEFCDSTFTVAEIEALYAEKNEAAAAAKQSEGAKAMYEDQWGEGAEHMRAYSCSACGAELICDDTTAATSCPYCGNPTVIPSQFAGARRPDYIIPFKLTQEDAVAALKQHYKRKPLLPRAFTSNHHIQEIKGIYVPFWLYNGEAEADYYFTATRTSSSRRGDVETITKYYYNAHRTGTVVFRNVPADGASKMPNDYMDAIEPYDYRDLKPFAMAYLPGYLADRYDLTAEQTVERVLQRMENSAELAMQETVTGYETVSAGHGKTKVDMGQISYALLPVYILNTKYKGKDYLFAMNGQTGKLVGELPMSWGRFFGWFAGIAAGTAAALTAILMLMYGM